MEWRWNKILFTNIYKRYEVLILVLMEWTKISFIEVLILVLMEWRWN